MSTETNNTTETAAKTRKAKQLAPYAVGRWNESRTAFTLNEVQPDGITSLGEIVAWVRANCKSAGKHEFIRIEPKSLTIAEQTVMKSILG